MKMEEQIDNKTAYLIKAVIPEPDQVELMKAQVESKEIEYLCIYDLECNCSNEKNGLKFNEAIELPMVIIDLKTNKRVAEFHTYIRPTAESVITEFCTELTGITQDMAFKNAKTGKPNPTLEEALN